MTGRPELTGLHHFRIPVSNVLVSRDWYIEVLGLLPMMVSEDEASVTGEALMHDSGLVVALHADEERARALEGFCLLSLAVDKLDDWSDYFARTGIDHVVTAAGPRAKCLSVRDPDGIVVELHTGAQPSTDET